MKKSEALRIFGGTRALAEALGISTQAVGRWGDEIPLLRQYQIEELLASRRSRRNQKAERRTVKS